MKEVVRFRYNANGVEVFVNKKFVPANEQVVENIISILDRFVTKETK